MAKEQEFSKAVVESDCIQVVQALQRAVNDSSDFPLVLDDTITLIFSFDSVVWPFAKRLGNKVAHTLAHFQLLEVGKRCWEDVFH